MISLAVGRLEVDWGKNSLFSDHGALFQSGDLKPVPTYYAPDDWPDGEPIVDMNEGFGKPLGQVVDRLELLGFTIRAVEHHYAQLHQFHGLSEQPIPFDELKKALARVDVNTVSGKYGEDYEPGEFVRKEILERLALRSEKHHYYHAGPRPDHWEVDLLLENLGANSALRLLAENPANLPLDVSWDFTPLVESGWATREAFRAGPSAAQRFLVVTEGSSDAKIIKKALDLYRPHISDFFCFVDMEEGYPFSGTGNLFRFVQGLVSIGIHNRTVVVYDNDAEGTSKLRRTESLTLPSNVRVIQLPDVGAFRTFRTVGPTGGAQADINGNAASIECYLDLLQDGLPEPVIRWTAYNRDLDRYQGELQGKSQYAKAFLELRQPSTRYDSTKIQSVIDALVSECVAIAEDAEISTFA
jgi:hypothetical protein